MNKTALSIFACCLSAEYALSLSLSLSFDVITLLMILTYSPFAFVGISVPTVGDFSALTLQQLVYYYHASFSIKICIIWTFNNCFLYQQSISTCLSYNLYFGYRLHLTCIIIESRPSILCHYTLFLRIHMHLVLCRPNQLLLTIFIFKGWQYHMCPPPPIIQDDRHCDEQQVSDVNVSKTTSCT